MVWRYLLFLLAAALIGSAGARAQEATPGAGFEPTARFPAHILSGTCDDPGEVVFPLSEGGYGLPATDGANDPASVTARYIGPDAATAAVVFASVLDVPLDQLVQSNHVVDAHSVQGGDEHDSRIVCGALGGFEGGDDLVFGLQEADGSRYHGVAWMHDNGDDTTTVNLFLIPPFGSPDELGASDAGTTTTPEAVMEADSLAPLPPTTETSGLVVENGDFTVERLTLIEDVPTVLHFVNSDNQIYVFEIDDLVVAREVPPNELSVIEFTTPSAGTYPAQLIDVDSGAVLAAIPVEVSAAGQGMLLP